MTTYSKDIDGNLIVVEKVNQTTTHTREDLERNLEMHKSQLAGNTLAIEKINILLAEYNKLEESQAIPKTIYTEQELIDLNKDEQIVLLNSYGITDIPQYEADRVAKILEMQG